jgi:glutaredoxin
MQEDDFEKEEFEHKKEPRGKDTLTIKKKDLYKAIGIIAVLLVIVAVSAIWMGKYKITGQAVTDTNNTGSKYAGEKVSLDFYIMSKCPYGIQVLDAIEPVLEKLGGALDFNVNYIASDSGNGAFNSLHGDTEVKGDIAELCSAKYNPESYMKMIICMDKDSGSIPTNWEKCATDNGLNTADIKACYEGDEGKQLMSASIKKSTEAQAQGSPTIYLNGAPYQGGRGTNDFLRAICGAYSGEKPQACSEIPAAKKVMAVVLNDKRCGQDCDTSGVIASLKSVFPGLETIELDYSSEQGKKIYDEANITNLPAILFDETVKDGEGYSNVQRYLEEAGKYTNLRIGASFNPTKEICDNKIDDTGDGKIDCDDADCKDSMVCREEKKNDLQVFIMSDCPYGKKAVEALKGVRENFGNTTTYEIHYIANENADGTFTSLHGTYEADEDMTQLCALKHSPGKWFDYVYCRSMEGIKGNDWKNCANSSEIDITKVQACIDGTEGKTLLSEDIKIAEGLGIGASPTWLANNKYQFSGIDAETAKTEYCKYNSAQKGCENTLSSDTGGVAAGGCGS